MPNTYSVSQINTYIKNMFAQDYLLGNVLITGEISNLKYHQSGHIYFTLKDDKAAISCVMFSSDRRNLSVKLDEGMKIVAKGSVQVYERDGKYQFYAKAIKAEGMGNLAEEFARLKAKLEEMGMFDPMYKKPIPKHCKVLGVVTAPVGAAVRDIINVAKRRDPGIQIILYPALVQGEGAPESIIKGINALEAYGVDVMIVGRGGGSQEDLWGFNSEAVAQTIFDCSVPIISAVGHETDWTIADYVSSLRAPTPSAAAELAVSDKAEILRHLDNCQRNMTVSMNYRISELRRRLEKSRRALAALSVESRLKDQKYTLMTLESRLRDVMEEIISNRKQSLSIYIERLKGLSPLEKLSQGYSHVSDEDGKTVYDVGSVKKSDKLTIHVQNGSILTEVLEVNNGWEK